MSLRGKILFGLIALLVSGFCYTQDLDNPLNLDNEWSGYGIGDPYVLKHRGLFYLYCSTKNLQTGVKCWSSKDLVNWHYEGLCSTDPITVTAYAPEVYYWNGTFYMYTSPGGNGHYVLSAPDPTGPFEVITPNLGRSIDGSVFIDDNASWYFYHASSTGIQGCPMAGPISFGMDKNLNAWMNNGWTEGPCVFKRNGQYYMIYTGNHVISKGYRIDYASNPTGPIDPYSPAVNQNPILLDALGYHVGLGHGSVFVGPDLDSYYLTYHNLVSGTGPSRKLNFDRIAWNGDKMILLGPTVFPQQNPEMPDRYDFFDRTEPGEGWSFPSGGRWSIKDSEYLVQDTSIAGQDNWFVAVMDSSTGDDYIAEFNLTETDRENNDSKLGVVFGYSDGENYGIALFNSFTNTLEINTLKMNSWETARFIDLPEDFDLSAWHSMRIEKYNGTYRFFVDGMMKHTMASDLGAGRIGYLTSRCHGTFSFVAFSNKINGSGTFDVHKPVPGRIPAMQYRQGGEGTGFHKEISGGPPEKILRSDEVGLVECPLGGYALAGAAGDWFSYQINVELDKSYNVEIIYATDQSDCSIRFLIDDSEVSASVNLPSTGDNAIWRSHVIKDLPLTAGYHSLKVKIISGSINLYSMHFVLADNAAFDERINFDGSFGTGWKYADGNWSISNKQAFIDGFGKRTYGSEAWRDYTVETDIMFTRSMNAGIICRVNNPALGGAGNDPALGTDYLQGYFVGFNFSSLVLGKHNYGWKMLANTSGSFALNTWYHLRAVVAEDRIRVFVDDMSEPKIDYTDTIPLINGMAGLRSHNTGVKFDNFRITSELLLTSDDGPSLQDPENTIEINPNPVSGLLNINFRNSSDRLIQIIDLNGRCLVSVRSKGDRITLPVHQIIPGLYFISVMNHKEIYTSKLIIN
jgi:xylan 1,4-beta-xylosidase